MTSSQRVHKSVVIGAGVAGLAAIKNCLDEGLEPVCFEQHDDLGGVWYYTPEPRTNQGAACFHNLVTNTSRETTCFTDFPVPDQYPQFMSHRDYIKYIKSYVEHFDLLRHIRFNTTVVRVWPRDDFASTGQWNVTVKSRESTEEEHFVFDSVFVCSGMLIDPKEPDIPGRDNYKGEIMHMHFYRKPEVFSDKSVLVIGNQHSAGDAASDATSCAQQVYLSPGKRGLTNVSRLNPRGLANELYGLNRFLTSTILSQNSIGRFTHSVAHQRLDYRKFGIKDGGNPFTDGVIMVNDELQYKITTGLVKVIPSVQSYTESGVLLEDGQRLDVDLVLLATGYKSNYDYIDVPCIKGKDFRLHSPEPLCLYKWVFPVDVTPATMVMCDAINVLGAHIPSIEMRCRWGARVLAGKCYLPSKDKMDEDIRKESKYHMDVCKGTVKMMWYDYCDAMADQIGCRPNFLSIFFRSPSLAYKAYLGPMLPCHYRLIGPGASEAAWRNSHAAYNRVYPPRKRSIFRQALLLLIPALLTMLYFRK